MSPSDYTRRRVLKSTTAAVSSATIMGKIGAEPITEDGDFSEVVVNRDLRDKHKVKTKLVPTQWYTHLTRIHEVHRDFRKKYKSIDGVRTTGIARDTSTKFGGKPGFSLKLNISPDGAGNLPDEYENQDVRIEEVKETGNLACDFPTELNEDESNVPGGVVVESDKGYTGTAYGKMWNSDGNPRLVTAAHIYEDTFCTDTSLNGKSLAQDSQFVGDVSSHRDALDVVLVDRASYSGVTLADEIEEDDGTRYTVDQYKTETGVSNLVSDNTNVRSTGINTGTTSGPVREKDIGDGKGCKSFGFDGVRSEVDVAAGDSGGPVYTIESGKAVFVHMNSEGWNKNGSCYYSGDYHDTYPDVVGTAHYEIENYLG